MASGMSHTFTHSTLVAEVSFSPFLSFLSIILKSFFFLFGFYIFLFFFSVPFLCFPLLSILPFLLCLLLLSFVSIFFYGDNSKKSIFKVSDISSSINTVASMN